MRSRFTPPKSQQIRSIRQMSWDASSSARVLDDLHEGVLVECDELVVYVNPAYAALLGYEPAQLIGTPLRQIIAYDDETRLLTFSQRRARNEDAPLQYAFDAKRNDGSVRRLFASVSVSTVGERMFITTIVRSAPDQPHSEWGDLTTLTDREEQILGMLLAEQRPKEIALALGISIKTVATHRRRICDKLGFQTAQDMFRFGLEHDLIRWS